MTDQPATRPLDRKGLTRIGAIAAAVLLIYLGVAAPLFTRWHQNRQDHATLVMQIDQATNFLGRESKLLAESMLLRSNLHEIVRTRLPNSENPMSWASLVVYDAARKCGLEVASVSEITFDRTGWSQPSLTNTPFVPYSVRVQVEGGYHPFRAMIEELEKGNPWIGVSGLTMAPNPQNPTSHNVGVTLQWPIWRNPDTPRKTLAEGGAGP